MRQNRNLSLWQPFRAASYKNYGESLKGLYKQGTPQAFYKGNGLRSIHILLFHKLNTEMTFGMEKIFGQHWKTIKEVPMLSELMLSCSIDMILQPLHVAESRFILQNRRTNFAAYDSVYNYFRKTPVQDMLRGNLIHLPRNFLVALQGLKLTDQIGMVSYFGQVVASQTLAYPFLLLQRRKECLTSSDYLRGRGFTGLSELSSTSLP